MYYGSVCLFLPLKKTEEEKEEPSTQCGCDFEPSTSLLIGNRNTKKAELNCCLVGCWDSFPVSLYPL